MAVNVVAGYKKTPIQQGSVSSNPLGQLLTIGGAVAGGVAGGLPGAATGASLGSMLGGIVAPSKVTQSSGGEIVQPAQTVQAGGMDKRLAELKQSDKSYSDLIASIDSLKYIQDDDLKLKLAEPLLRADLAAQKQTGQV